MGVDPVCWTRFPLAFPSESWAHAMQNSLLYQATGSKESKTEVFFAQTELAVLWEAGIKEKSHMKKTLVLSIHHSKTLC